jgi:aminoglycoside phosphotransferase (APT) family kinase protein
LYTHYYPTEQALIEGHVQNSLHALGYPAPRVVRIGSETTTLGHAFIIMQWMPGQPMIQAIPFEEMPAVLAHTHLELHTIDPMPVVHVLARYGISRSVTSFLETLSSHVMTGNLAWLQPSLQWLHENAVADGVECVVCHSDFHPLNVLVDHDTISGVLDWAACRIGEREFDVAHTRSKLSCVAPVLLPRYNWQLFVEQYDACYQDNHPLNNRRIEYYEALYCFRSFVELARGVGQHLPIGVSGVQERLLHRFHEITGLKPRPQ